MTMHRAHPIPGSHLPNARLVDIWQQSGWGTGQIDGLEAAALV